MKLYFPRLALFFLIVSGWTGWAQGIVTVWDGPLTNFDHPDGVGTSVQDRLTPAVWLTRDLSQGLINSVVEAAYTHNLSPANTEWAYGALADYASLGYASWEQWNNKKPPTMLNQPAVVHLISDNIYLSLTFTSWGGVGGAFTYDRSTPSAVPEPSAWALGGLSGLLTLAVIARSKRISPHKFRRPALLNKSGAL